MTGEALVEDVAGFGARLRAEGVPVDAVRLAAFAQACASTSMVHAYWAGRATLTSDPAHIAPYDRAFAGHFGAAPGAQEAPDRDERPVDVPELVLAPPDASDSEGDAERAATPASLVELLRRKRFDDCTEEELRELERLVRRISWVLPPRPGRRRVPARRGRPDVRRTLRRALRHRHDDWRLERRARRRRRRALVLLLDVSGSMAAYSRMLLFFAHGALATDQRWEAFCFGTRLTRLTPALRAGGPEAALRAASAAIEDWHGGTRIGLSLKALLDGWGQTRALRGAVVVICSDGLEVGEPDVLAVQMARLQRVARQVIWLNPLKGLAGYEPLARGMSAALPHIDRFASGDTLSSLQDIADQIALAPGLGGAGAAGRRAQCATPDAGSSSAAA